LLISALYRLPRNRLLLYRTTMSR